MASPKSLFTFTIFLGQSLLFLTLFAHAGSLEGVQAGAAKDFVFGLRVKIRDANFSAEDARLLHQIQDAWLNKCAKTKTTANCMLRERDVFPDSERPDFVLLFRGESKDRAIGLSALKVFGLRHPEFCGGECTSQSLVANLRRVLSKLPAEAPAALCAGYQKDAVFRVDLDRWIMENGNGGCAEDAFVRLEAEHVGGKNRLIIQQGNDSFPLDPFVSLSQDPNISFDFAGVNFDKSGRLLILSVDERRIPRVQSKADSSEVERGFFAGSYLRFEHSEDTFDFEREVDAVIQIPTADIQRIIEPSR
jgi:hypothetical protein